MTSEEERDYIEYYMWRNSGKKTVKEIAEALGVRYEKVWAIARELNIPVKHRETVNMGDCKNRPAACFKCPASDCRCQKANNRTEAEYLYKGIGDDPEKYHKRQRKIKV